MSKQEIKIQIKNLITDELKNNTYNNIDEISLTSTKIGMSSISMTYLFFKVEKLFDIKINTDKILNYEFNTIEGISSIVSECLELKGEK